MQVLHQFDCPRRTEAKLESAMSLRIAVALAVTIGAGVLGTTGAQLATFQEVFGRFLHLIEHVEQVELSARPDAL